MEKGFYHASRGYWQTLNEPPKRIFDGYPEGTFEVPLRPQGNFEWNGLQWVDQGPDISTKTTAARTKRNQLLTASDWTQVADAPVDQPAWAIYRQALRDVTDQESFPEDIAWPVQPV